MLSSVSATLSLRDDALVLRYAFGLASKRVALPPRSIEVGGLLVRRSAPSASSDEAYDVRSGSYLRLSDAHGSITLGCKKGTQFRKHWSGQTNGLALRRWDVQLAPASLVAIEHVLVERGALEPRPEPSAST